jgi:hypothetical protein
MIGVIWYDKAVELYGGTGTIYDRKKAYYDSEGMTGTLYDQEMEWLAASGWTGTLHDRWMEYLASYPGTIYDKLNQISTLL